MRDERSARLLAAAPLLALLPTVLVFMTMLLRLRYPFEVHWMEGLTLDHVMRVWHHQPLYIPPSLDFVPFLYNPFYYYAAALVGHAVGEGFVALRLTSILAFGATLLTLGYLVRHESGSWRAGLLGAGVLAGTYTLNGAWFDQGRVDSLFLFLLVAGIAALRLSQRGMMWALAGVLWALAYLTKQMALAICAPIALVVLWQARGRSLWLIVPWVGVIIGATLWLNAQSDGWYRFYTSEMVSSPYHLIGMTRLSRVIGFWITDVIRPLSLPLLLTALYLAWAWRHERSSALFYSAVALGMVGVSWFHRAHTDTDLNGLMSTHAMLALGTGLGWPRVVATIASLDAPHRVKASVAASGLLVLFLMGLLFNPTVYIPSAADQAAGEQVVARIRDVPGSVFIPYHSYLAPLAGKPPHAHAIPIGDLLRSGQPPRELLIAEMRTALAERRFGALLLDEGDYLSLMGRDDSYALAETLFTPDNGAFLPRTGTPYRPTYLWLPK